MNRLKRTFYSCRPAPHVQARSVSRSMQPSASCSCQAGMSLCSEMHALPLLSTSMQNLSTVHPQ
jgi:hypothetical protein